MAVNLSSLKRDLTAESAGTRIASPAGWGGVFYNVRSISYPPYVQARSAASERFRRSNGQRPMTADETAAIIGRLASDHLLLGWEGFADRPYDAAGVAAVLTDTQFSFVLDDVLLASVQAGQVTAEVVAEAAGNSGPQSAGA